MEAVPMQTLTSPTYIENLANLDIAELRARRDRCSEAEVGLSYARRMVHGRLDIVGAERKRRTSTEGGADGRSLIERLPSILGDHAHAPGNGRLPQIMAPGEADLAATREVDAIAPLARMGALGELTDDQLVAMEKGLVEVEVEVSGRRRELHTVFDKLQDEVIRRYRSGEADVNDLLR